MQTRYIAAVFLTAFATSGSAHDLLDDLIEAKDLICEFHVTGQPRSMLRRMVEGEHFDMLLVIEGIDPGSGAARAVSSKQAGRKSLRYYRTGRAVHFVQDVATSVVVTTVNGCEAWGHKGDVELCVRYRALNSWHFDTSVHRDPDKAFDRLGTSSYYGSCEPWYLNGVTTTEMGDRPRISLQPRVGPEREIGDEIGDRPRFSLQPRVEQANDAEKGGLSPISTTRSTP